MPTTKHERFLYKTRPIPKSKNYKMRTNVKNIASIIITSIICSCQIAETDNQLEYALELAKDNRQEMEKVLDHFSDDSVKYEAAAFLIRNMPGHYSYADTTAITKYSHEVDSIVTAMRDSSDYALRDSINSCTTKSDIRNQKKASDIETMKADYLIANIEEAFHVWKEGYWAKHVNFDDFCEYILPYKVYELQILDDWRTRLKHCFNSGIEELQHCDLFKNSAYSAARKMNQELHDSLKPNHAITLENANLQLETKLRIPFGTCDHYADIASILMRCQGIPVMQDFTPQWAYRDSGHKWNVILANNGKNIPFSGVCTMPGDPHKMDEKMAKVYRYTYSQNKEMIDIRKQCINLPKIFSNIFIKDVTREYISCKDVEIKLWKSNGTYAFLGVFNNKEWIPVAYSRINHGKATFKDMGLNIMYIPMGYDDDNNITILGYPFILNYDGSISIINADESKKVDLHLSRKYPTFEYVYEVLPRLLGGEFQASNDADFSNYYTVHKITECNAQGYQIDVPDTIPPCRYWRYYTERKAAFNTMAEIMFFKENCDEPIYGKVIGSEGSWGDNPERYRDAAFDGDILTFFDAPDPDKSWVGMDYGEPVKMSKFIYYGRGDGNSIELGDNYELFLWDKNKWQSMGIQKASSPTLVFKGMPSGGLYLLKDLTKGNDERIFLYENGVQQWW